MVSLGSLFGEGTIGQQFFVWQVLGQLAGAALNPALLDAQQAVNSLDPVATLTPEQLAVGVAREILDAANSEDEAAKSGIGAGRFAQLIQLAESPPALSMILAAYQRSLGDAGGAPDALVDVDKALADLGISSQYRGIVKALAIEIPTAQQVLNAWLEGQISEDEARGRILATGMDPSWITTAYNSEGQAPTPVEALELLNRGIIAESGTGPDSTSYEQAFREGPWRDKWLAPFKALRTYLPPPRTVTALLKEGSITEAQATQYLQSQGLDSTLTAIYIAAASHSTNAAQRELTQAQIVAAYEDQLLTHEQAIADLVAARFSAADANLLLALADKKQALASVKAATSRLQTLYLNHTNTLAQTQAALHQLGLTDTQVATLTASWDLEKSSTVKTLTESQIVSAWFYGVLDPNPITNTQTALGKLQAIGYNATDAMILLAARNHGPLTAAQGGSA